MLQDALTDGRARSTNHLRRFPLTIGILACWIVIVQLLFGLLHCQDVWAWTGRVIELEDGDSGKALSGLTIIEFRLYGIDAPESDQPYATQAKFFASRVALWRQIDFKTLDRDQYGREVGLAYVNGQCLNSELIKSGFAWVYQQYCKESFCKEWAVLEGLARSKKAGLWRGKNPIPPWQHRRQASLTNSNGALDDKPQPAIEDQYHGNTSSKVFHSPKCAHYNCRNCTARFSSRDQAIQAGFKPCAICKP